MLLRGKQDEIFKDVDDDQTVFSALYCDAVCRDGFSCLRGGCRRFHWDAIGETHRQRQSLYDSFGYSVAISDGIAVADSNGITERII